MQTTKEQQRPIVVLIDNNEMLLSVLKLLLERNNYDAIIFSDGHEALPYLLQNSHNIDLVVTDLHMALSLSGVEIIDKIRLTGIHLPILVLSANLDREMHNNLACRGIRMIAKPISGQDFLQCVKDALSKGKAN